MTHLYLSIGFFFAGYMFGIYADEGFSTGLIASGLGMIAWPLVLIFALWHKFKS